MSIRPAQPNPFKDRLQNRLVALAAGFVFLNAAALTVAAAVRLHTWEVSYRWQHWIGVAVWLVGFLMLNNAVRKNVPDRDPYILPAAALLSGWGLVTIFRLDEDLGLRQTAWLAVAIAAAWYLLRQRRTLIMLRHFKYLWLFLGLGLTALTFLIGIYPAGTGPRLWLTVAGFYLQPSEPLKLLLLGYLAAYLADHLPLNTGWLQLLVPTVVMAGTALLVLISQRDLGTASLFIMLYAAVLYIAYGRRRIIILSALALILASLVGYNLFDVIHRRVDTWMNPWIDPSGSSYQVVQSLISVASGSLFGTGIGLGSPGVVPVAYSDFIFSAIAEESGLLGAGGLLLALALLCGRGITTAIRAPSRYQRYLAGGLVFYLAFQIVVIIGGNLGLIPLTGVTLPFISYGGSSLLTSFISLALLLTISGHTQSELDTEPAGRQFVIAGISLLVAMLVLMAGLVWWGFVRAEELQTRNDNPRWAIGERYVQRGQILDHNNQPLAYTTGETGSLVRIIAHAPLSPTIGYTNARFGQAGLESSLDSYLRGLQGTPTSTVILYKLLYAQTPPGNDVRLSLDIHLQQRADSLMEGHAGALVLLNASSGEILALASHPYFDSNQLDQRWEFWKKNESSVFVNRATQGQYPIGTAMGPFLLANAYALGRVGAFPDTLTSVAQGTVISCAAALSGSSTWGSAIANGCPGASQSLGAALPGDSVTRLYNTLGFDQAPVLPLPISDPLKLLAGDPERQALGLVAPGVSPLQMALAAAMLSNGGTRPAPRLAVAFLTPSQDWVAITSAARPSQTLAGSDEAARAVALDTLPAWGVVANGYGPNSTVTWFLTGTLPDWKGTPLALALVLEENNPTLARDISINLMRGLLEP